MTAPNFPQTPSKPPVDQGPAGARTQSARRYTDTFWDDCKHPTARGGLFANGRPWCGEREIAANTELLHEDGFCQPDLMRGEYIVDEMNRLDRAATLGATWHAPWTPLPKYFRFNYPRKRITFDLNRMRDEEERALELYYEAAAILGAELNVKVEYGVMPSFQITAKLGRPSKMLKIAEAATARDPWLLGFIDEPNPELAAILGFNQRGMKVTSYTPPAPVVTPEQVIATPQSELLAMIADMQQQMAAQAKIIADLTAPKTKTQKPAA